MGCVGLELARWNPPPRRRQASVAPRPHPVRAAKVGDARVGADAGAREGDDVLALNDPSSDRLDALFEALFLGHGICSEGTSRAKDSVSESLVGAHAVSS